MKGYRGNVEFHYRHVLNYQGIGPGAVQVPDYPFRLRKFVITEYGIERNIYFYPVHMGILGKHGYIFHRIACSRPCAETGRTDIYGIGPVQYRFFCGGYIAGWRQQLYRPSLAHTFT